MTPNRDRKQYAPATLRNREPIRAVLQRVLPPAGTVLEVASGTGEHAAFFAPRLSGRRWLPSDVDAFNLASIAAWREESGAENLEAPILLDVREAVWGVEANPTLDIRAIANINMIHISPWDCTLGLMAGAERLLPTDGILYLYGPFKRGGEHTAPSNASFDAMLRSQNPAWGVRDLSEVTQAARDRHLELLEVIEMPANNFSVIFRKITI